MDLVLTLRELRRMRGLSQKDVARLSGIGEKTLSSFETGERIDSLKLSQLTAILGAYGVTLADVFAGGVEAAIFAELERLTDAETAVIRELRRVPENARNHVVDRVVAFIAGSGAVIEPTYLRAVR